MHICIIGLFEDNDRDENRFVWVSLSFSVTFDGASTKQFIRQFFFRAASFVWNGDSVIFDGCSTHDTHDRVGNANASGYLNEIEMARIEKIYFKGKNKQIFWFCFKKPVE